MKRHHHAWLLVPAAALALALTGCGGTKIDLTDYAAVSFDGINGQGKATCYVDTVSLEQTLAGDDDGEISAEELEQLGWITQFEMTVSCQMDKETGLSNGDTVTVSVTCDEDFAKEHKVTVTEGSKEYTVEGLKEPIPVDAFDAAFFDTENGVVLEYTKASPVAGLTIVNQCTSEPACWITYTADKTYDLSNGDVIHVEAALSPVATQQGYVLTETSKDITVEGLNSYVSSLSQLQAEDRQAVEDKIAESFRTEITGYVDYTAADGYSMDLIDGRTGSCENFALAQDEYTCYRPEMAIIPFTADVTLETDWWNREYFKEGITKNFPNSYGYFTVTGLELDADGKLMDLDNVQISLEAMFETKDDMEREIRRWNAA